MKKGGHRDRSDISEWIGKAEQDFSAAVILVRKRKVRTSDVTCFLAQQCAEKYLKAFLVAHRISFPRTHDLRELLDLCLPMDPLIEVLRSDLEALLPYAVEIRYPGDEATPAEARAAVNRMSRVREFLRKKLGLSGRLGRRKRK